MHVLLLRPIPGNDRFGLGPFFRIEPLGLEYIAAALEMTPAAAHQLDIVRRMGLDVSADPAPAQLVVDALVGYSLRGDPSGRVAELIDWTNAANAPVLALDVPSGLDATTGRAANPSVAATATLTLALPKLGLLEAHEVGELYLADISVPPLVYERMGLLVPKLFTEDGLVEVQRQGLFDQIVATLPGATPPAPAPKPKKRG